MWRALLLGVALLVCRASPVVAETVWEPRGEFWLFLSDESGELMSHPGEMQLTITIGQELSGSDGVGLTPYLVYSRRFAESGRIGDTVKVKVEVLRQGKRVRKIQMKRKTERRPGEDPGAGIDAAHAYLAACEALTEPLLPGDHLLFTVRTKNFPRLGPVDELAIFAGVFPYREERCKGPMRGWWFGCYSWVPEEFDFEYLCARFKSKPRS